MLLQIINPFAELNETKRYPYARTLRTTFWQKMRDTFFIFFGSFNLIDEDKEYAVGRYHFGLIDFFTLGLSYVLSLVSYALLQSDLPKWFTIPVNIIHAIAITVPRLVVASVFTFLSLPFVGIVQLITDAKSKELKNQINDFPVPITNSSPVSMFNLLQAKGCQLEYIDLIKYKKNLPSKGMPLGDITLDIRVESESKVKLEFDIDSRGNLVNSKARQFFTALQELNVGHIDEVIDDQEIAAVMNAHLK